jgi:hypothetical protein
MNRSHELAEEIRPFLIGKRNRLFSELEETLNEVYNHLKNMPTGVPSPPPKAPAPVLRGYRVELILTDEIMAENEAEAWDMALEKISTRKGMHLCGHKLERIDDD